jgi:pimeloyl-ACP methyl ester carboxylesterase
MNHIVFPAGRALSARLAQIQIVTIVMLTFAAGSCVSHSGSTDSPKIVSFPTPDGGRVVANLYGEGSRSVLLAHGGRFNKESWDAQARKLARAGFRVLAIDFRGYGQSKGPSDATPLSAPLYWDVLAGIRYLRINGAKTVGIVGGSMGGGAAADACIMGAPAGVNRLVLLGANPTNSPERLDVPKLFIMARDDTSGDGPRLPGVLTNYDRCPEPKRLVLLEGSAHAQFIFQTKDADRVMQEIIDFLSAP